MLWKAKLLKIKWPSQVNGVTTRVFASPYGTLATGTWTRLISSNILGHWRGHTERGKLSSTFFEMHHLSIWHVLCRNINVNTEAHLHSRNCSHFQGFWYTYMHLQGFRYAYTHTLHILEPYPNQLSSSNAAIPMEWHATFCGGGQSCWSPQSW